MRLSSSAHKENIPKCTEFEMCCADCASCANSKSDLRKTCAWAYRLDSLLMVEARRYVLESDVQDVLTQMLRSSYLTSRIRDGLPISESTINALFKDPLEEVAAKVLDEHGLAHFRH